MRLLVLIDRYPPHHKGGDETACLSVVERLRERGHEIRVLTSQYGVANPLVEGDVYRVLHTPENTPSLLTQLYWELQDHQTFQRHVREFLPDLVACWSLFGLFASMHVALRQAHLPVVYNLPTLWLESQMRQEAMRYEAWQRPSPSWPRHLLKSLLKWIAPRMNRNCLRKVTMQDVDLQNVVFCSRTSEKYHRNAALSGDHWTVIYNGLDLRRFRPAGRTKKGAMAILFAGRLVPEKGAHTAIAAVRELLRRGRTEVRLDIAGHAGYPATYVERIHEEVHNPDLQSKVNLLGFVPYTDMPDLLGRYDVLVFPSTFAEGFPMMLIEAMASGMVVVASLSGGSKEILCDGVNSLLFEPESAVQLADQLERLIDDEELAGRLSKAGNQWVREHCDNRILMTQWEEYLSLVLRDYQAAARVAQSGSRDSSIRAASDSKTVGTRSAEDD